ncbi:protein HMG coenzyme A reductase-like protein [Daphnia pulex]|uniref:3-hydroxy-3-methylglutaryl coenzyme A reductase n=1 Tax=Daphnia pulex TaxID=6669 RepID=E9GHR2_DAPPU|nr:protein HMG coenzyme A reductase-like protein [Daphnia pulex]|eukprot:EFX81008.1 protein HMG coenzyme A reductase-like protein [Daphnia pulex]
MGFLAEIFKSYGLFCAQHPWQVIFLVLTSTVAIISSQGMHTLNRARDSLGSPQPLDIVLMTTVRAVAVLYSYHRLRSLHRSHSRFVLSLAGLFTVFSSFVFTCSVVNVMQSDLSDLKDALFFFLLLIDVVKACTLAYWSLSCSVKNAAEVALCISQGMAVLGPAITLDTLVETLVIGVGTLSGVRRLEVLCGYGCMSAVVNYVVFMTFYPACLALVLEVNSCKVDQSTAFQWQHRVKLLKQMMAMEQPNPLVQRVKLIMAAGLMVVHAHSHFLTIFLCCFHCFVVCLFVCFFRCSQWVFLQDGKVLSPEKPGATFGSASIVDVAAEDSVLRWLSDQRADQLVLLILIAALTIKFTFFDDRNQTPHRRNRCVSFVISDNEESSFDVEDKEVQTEPCDEMEEDEQDTLYVKPVTRTLEESHEALKISGSAVSDQEVLNLINARKIELRQLEKVLGDAERGVRIRRRVLSTMGGTRLEDSVVRLPYKNYDYSKVFGVCCENVIGYVPLPVGFAGPLIVDGESYFIPMATTEGCLVASTNRGCSALAPNGGVRTQLIADGMSRGPVFRLPDIRRAGDVMAWLQEPSNIDLLKKSFNATSRFGRLQKIRCQIAGRHVFIRFVAKTGDAMGMNMVSKGTEAAIKVIQSHFADLAVVSLSGNFCTDKKPAAVNWLDGRGKSVVSEAIIPAAIVRDKLKTNVASLVDLNITKNLIGSSIAGSIGGFNAHAANIVSAIFIATGQDPAQVVSSSNCMTLMEPWGPEMQDLYISCTMPSLEVGTIGGGTWLPAQGACLDMLGLRGSNAEEPGANACRLARIICAAVLAGELSLMSSLATGTLVQSHMTHNRSYANITTPCLSS